MKTLPSSANSGSPVDAAQRRDEPLRRRYPLRAGVQQHEAAGAVGVLGHAGTVAPLAEERRLLIAGDAGDRNARAQEVGRRLAEHAARRAHVRQQRARDPEQLEQLLVPAPVPDVVEQRARRVGRIGDVQPAARELPRDPGVDRAECELAALGARARARDRVEQPGELGGGEVGVDHEPGLRAHRFGGAVGPQPVARIGGAPVLPDDRVGERRAGRALPEHRRLALVGDADRRDVTRGDTGVGERFLRDRELRAPDLLRIVLDPAGLREDLAELALREAAHRAGLVEDDGARAGGALIEGEDDLHSVRDTKSGKREG